jgi:outer membrane receptor protein involved in Fe transport
LRKNLFVKRQVMKVIPSIFVVLVWVLYVISETRADSISPQKQESNKSADLFEMSIEQLMEVQVTTTSRVEERRDNAPGSIYVYPSSVIKTRGYRSLGELLQTVPGFTVFHRDLQFVAGVRGLNANDNEKITLLINGQELNGVNEFEFLNGPINLDNVDRVEVIVGPSSLFQRANTLAATVNVITKDVDGMEVVASTGNALPYSVTVMAGKQFDSDRSLNLSFTTEKKRGFDAWASDFRPNIAGTTETGRLEDSSFFGILNGERGEWSGQVVAYRAEFPELLINNGSALNDATYTDQIYSAFIKNEHVLNNDLTTLLSFGAAYKKSTRLNDNGLPQPDTACEQSIAQWDYDAEFGIRYTGFKDHMIQTGVQGAIEDNFDCFFTWNATTSLPSFPQETTLYDKDTAAVGFYASDTFTINDKLELINGIRTDLNTILGHRWFLGGRSAIIYKPRKNWTTKFIYNRSVRFPSPLAAMNEVWGRGKNGPPWTRHFPNATEPEILSTFEWQNIVYFKRVRLGLTGYYQELNDFISWSEPHSNVGNFRGFGAEADIQAQMTSNFSIWANTAYNDSELHAFHVPSPTGPSAEQHHAVINSDNRIIGSAEITANMGLDWKINKHVTLTSAVRYFMNQAAHDFTANRYIEIGNRVYLDAALVWENAFGRDMDIRVSGMNILNNRKHVAGQWLGDTYRPRGATILVSAYIRF